jgi:hypothetical protein
MNELISKDPEYKKVLSSYYNLVKTSILRKESEEFVGGLPITLLRKHMFNLLRPSNMYHGYSKYSVTSKVDGTRLLMFINEEDPINPGFRQIHFIDRSLKIYKLSNKEKYKLNSIKSPRMILDGELVFFKDSKSHYYLPSGEVDYLSFMVFDIIYGPTSVKLEDPMIDINPVYGSANSMAGPVGGKQWDYARRLNILYNLILKTKDNAGRPPLSLEFCNNNFFRIEMKKILNLNTIPSSESVEKYIHDDFILYRKQHFDYLNTLCDSKTLNDKLKKSKLEFDGLIFTPIDTSYVIGNWNLFMNTQYKWKPPKDQTIDFLVKSTGNTIKLKGQVKPYLIVDLYVLSRGNLQKFNFEGSSTGLVETSYIVEDDTIAEFGYSTKHRTFMFNRLRLDKDKPNAWRTAETVKMSILQPIDINLLPKLKTANTTELIDISTKYFETQQLNNLLMCTGSLSIIPPYTEQTIKDYLKFKNISTEFEVRIGKLKGKYFDTSVNEYLYSGSKTLFENFNWKHTYTNYVDTQLGKERTRFKFVPELKKLIKIESITKESIQKIDNSLKGISNFDIRFSVADENSIDKTITYEEAERITAKDRISFTSSNYPGVIVDLTEVSILELKSSELIKKGKSEFQIEFEFSTDDYNLIINFIKFYISEMNTVWD